MTLEDINRLIINSMFANIAFIDSGGNPEIRKVFCTWHKGLGTHLISTNTSSMHVQAFLKKPSASLYFDNSETFEGICFTGKATVHFDKAFKTMCWKEGDEQYYPKGVEDEDYCILEFQANQGRYYRYDGIGDVKKADLEVFDQNAEFIDYYDRLDI